MAHRPNIFRKLRESFRFVKTHLDDEAYSDEHELYQDKLDALKEINRFVKSFAYLKHDGTKERVEYYIRQSGFSCKVTAAYFGTSTNNIDKTIKYASDILRSVIGSPLDQIMQAKTSNEVSAALMEFRLAAKQERPMEFFLPGLTSFLPESDTNNAFPLGDCTTELATLSMFTKRYVKNLIEACDPYKLAYVLSLLSGRGGSALDKNAVVRLLRGDFYDEYEWDALPLRLVNQVNRMTDWKRDQNPFSD